MRRQDELESQVRDALAHLNDVVYLQTHPLAELAPVANAVAPHRGPGHALREQLLAAIEGLRPSARDSTSEINRGYLVLQLRYVEGLDPAAAGARLGLGRSQFYREQERALRAVTSVVAATWARQHAAEVMTPSPDQHGRVESAWLPRPSTSFVGRSGELTTIGNMFDRDRASRLLTISGAPGVGKTRLAAEATALMISGAGFEQVYFVDLSALQTPETDQVAACVLRGLGLPMGDGRDPVQAVIEYLSDRRVLLVLDNFEQLIQAATLVTDLLEACPNTRVLVTSRRPLGLYGERELALQPLSLPSAEAPVVDDVDTYPAVQLFADRATAVDPGFQITPENQSAIVDICRRLDGLPLAIELAAARLRVLPPHALLKRLNDRLGVLTRAARDTPSRHQTLRAAIDWSYELLEAEEKVVLNELSVFAGSFALAAAEQVISTPSRPLLDVLQSLLEHGLLVLDSAEPRYRLLETIREYAAQRLSETEQMQVVRARHMEYYLRAEHHRGEPETRFGIEDDSNLHAALQAVLQQTLADAREQRDPRQVALALAGLASVALQRGDLALARARALESRQLFVELGDAHGTALAEFRTAQIGARGGSSSPGEVELRASVGRLRDLGAFGAVSEGLVELGRLELERGNVPSAVHYTREALELACLGTDREAATAALQLAAAILKTTARDAASESLINIAAGRVPVQTLVNQALSALA